MGKFKLRTIAILIPNLLSGGSERLASRLSIALQDKFIVYFIVFDGENPAYNIGGNLIDLNLPALDGKLNKAITFFKRILAIRNLVKKNKIELICSFTSAANSANAFSFAYCKKIISCRGFEHLCKKTQWYKLLLNLTNGILFNSKAMQGFYLKKYPKDKEKTFIIYNFFDIDNIKKLQQQPTDATFNEFVRVHKIVITISQFSNAKGQWHLIKAFEILKDKVKDAGLVFVGHRGSLEEQIKQMAQTSKYKDDILFVGFQNNPFKFLGKSNVYALCSINEGFPNALVEAMACGIPAVATNCKTGPSEALFEEYDNAFSCDKMVLADYGIITPTFRKKNDFNLGNKDKTHFEYAKALEIALTNNEIKNKYAKIGLARAEEFNEKNMINKYINIFKKVMGE